MVQAHDPLAPASGPGAPPRSRWLVQLALTVAFVALLAWRLDVGEALALLGSIDPLWLGAALAAAVLDRVWMIGKWLPLLAVQAPAIGRLRAARSYLAAGFTNYFLPATVGSDALRAASLGRPHGAVAEVGASIAAERVLGAVANAVLVALVLYVALPRPRELPLPGLSWLAAVALCAAALVVLIPFRHGARAWLARRSGGRIAGLVQRFVEALAAYRHVPGTLAVVFALTLIEVFIPIAIVWLLAQSLALEIPFTGLLVAVPLSMLVAKLPISVAGIGPQEASLVSLLAAYGVAPEAALALAIPNRLIDVAIAVPGAWALRELWRDLRTAPAASPMAATPAGKVP